MKAFATPYLNEIVGLTVMALMAVALIAGQADATVHQAARNDAANETSHFAAHLEAVAGSAIIRANLEINLDRLLEAATEESSHDTFLDFVTTKPARTGSAVE